MLRISVGAERDRIDAFHTDFTSVAAAAPLSDDISAAPRGATSEPYCGGCSVSIATSSALWCGACKCTAYCDRECQLAGWKAGGHKAACKLLARARALPPADPSRSYVVQLKLVGQESLKDWATHLEQQGEADVASVHREMAAALSPRERVLFALEARHHALLHFQMVPPNKKLEAADLALFALRAVVEPVADVPTLNMPRNAPHRPYAIWIPGDDECDRPMAGPVGKLLAAAGLATSAWYVGGGFCAEMRLRPGADEAVVHVLAELDPDHYTEDDDEENEDEEGPGGREVQAGGLAAEGAAPGPGPARVLVVSGLHIFGTSGEGQDPLLSATAAALRSAGMQVEVGMYLKKDKQAQEALAQRLASGAYTVCVVLGLGSGDDFKPRNPTQPWGDGAWRDALTAWVRSGGVCVVHGERAAAAVARTWFNLAWTMEGDHYRRTDHMLNTGCPLLGGLARRLPPAYNVKACMLSSVPPAERVYATTAGAVTHSLVPSMAGGPVDAGMCAMAAARCGGGSVAFFGDVNWEAPTMAAVTQLVQELAPDCRRRAAAT